MCLTSNYKSAVKKKPFTSVQDISIVHNANFNLAEGWDSTAHMQNLHAHAR